ncbi:MAG: hypothetical protein IKA79_06865 [Lentisphaeria bacterium]|nr:hypothetical protein [Lentisphaeria bacterium]
MKNILLFILLVSTAAVTYGQEPPVKKTSLFFRYGILLSAEACSSKPAIKNPTLTMQKSNSSHYVEVVFQPDKGRSLSMHDFALAQVHKDASGTESTGTENPCIAIAEGDNPYDGAKWNIREMDPAVKHRMLFAAPSTEGEFTLVFRFTTKIKERPFKLKSVSRFSKAGEILNKGQLLLPDPPPPPEPPKEEPKGEEKGSDNAAGENKDGAEKTENNGDNGNEGGNPPE